MKRVVFAGLAMVAVSIAASADGPCGAWQPGLGDPRLPQASFSTSAWDPDGPGPLPESMTVVTPVSASPSSRLSVRFWDGAAWRPVGPDFTAGSDRFSLRVLDGQLLALGDFDLVGDQSVRFAARWDGFAWRQMGSDPPDTVNEGVVLDGVLHVADGVYPWRWTGATWQRVNIPLVGLTRLGVYQGKLVGSGLFTVPGSPSSTNIAILEGGAWRPLGLGLDAPADTFAEFEGSLVVGGPFASAGGAQARSVAKWDGTSWSEMGQGLGTVGVRSLLVHDGELIAGGPFAIAARGLHGVARWSGMDWAPMGPGIAVTGIPSSAGVFDLAVVNDQPVAAGVVVQSRSGRFLGNASRWDGSDWLPVAPGYFAEKLIEHDGAVISAGRLGAYLGFPRHGLARWDGAAWSPYAAHPDAGLYFQSVFARDGDALIASASGEILAPQFVLRWDGGSWSQLGGPIQGFIYALGIHDGQVIVGGTFSAIGAQPVSEIAAWDGSAWNPLGAGLDGAVNAIASFDGRLVAGGAFAAPAGSTSPALMQWDGAAWSELGPRLSGTVEALATFDGDLIAAGFFARAGELTVNHIARWDGAAWSPLGQGVNGRVLGLTTHGGELIAVGDFTMADGVPASHIAVWNGSAWRALGAGLNDRAWGVAALGDQVLTTGRFTQAGGEVSSAFALWEGCPPCPADLDGDGLVDFSDYLAFLNFYDAGDPAADLNGDGLVDFADYLDFLTAYDGGC